MSQACLELTVKEAVLEFMQSPASVSSGLGLQSHCRRPSSLVLVCCMCAFFGEFWLCCFFLDLFLSIHD